MFLFIITLKALKKIQKIIRNFKEIYIFNKVEMGKDFIMAYKATPYLFLSREDMQAGLNIDVESLKDKECILVYIKGVEFPLKLSKHVLKAQNNKEVALYYMGNTTPNLHINSYFNNNNLSKF